MQSHHHKNQYSGRSSRSRPIGTDRVLFLPVPWRRHRYIPMRMSGMERGGLRTLDQRRHRIDHLLIISRCESTTTSPQHDSPSGTCADRDSHRCAFRDETQSTDCHHRGGKRRTIPSRILRSSTSGSPSRSTNGIGSATQQAVEAARLLAARTARQSATCSAAASATSVSG